MSLKKGDKATKVKEVTESERTYEKSLRVEDNERTGIKNTEYND